MAWIKSYICLNMVIIVYIFQMHYDNSKLPGCSEYVRIPKASTRLANSAACITFASFDCWYAVILLYDPGVFWK